MAENKVQFNLKNVHYALLQASNENGKVSYAWETPVAVPGAVTLTLDPAGDVTPFYADGVIYYSAVSNQGYSGSLEMARFPDQMLQEIWGFTKGETSNVLTENASINPKDFALLYQIDGDAGNQYYVMYNCTATRPGVGSATTTASKEPQTQTTNLTAAALLDGRVMARTTATTPDDVKAAWFSAVYEDTTAAG